MQERSVNCVDAGTESCPCILAETGDCLVCSRLQGRQECDCDWSGVCVFNEFVQNGSKRMQPRMEHSAPVLDVYEIDEGAYTILRLFCGTTFALQCMHPGIHIFARKEGSFSYFDVPLSILSLDQLSGTVTLCFRVISAKTKTLAACEKGDRVLLRGPYRSGILNLSHKKLQHINAKSRHALLLAAGAGMIPAIHALNYQPAGTVTDFIAFGGRAERSLLKDFLTEQARLRLNRMEFRTDDAFFISEKLEVLLQHRHYDKLLILGSDTFIEKVQSCGQKYTNTCISCSNNHVLLCGEGTCGACGKTCENGTSVPVCKCGHYHVQTT